MTTHHLPITDTAIKRHAADPAVRELNDSRHPLRLRFHTNRERASWFLVTRAGGRNQWRKLGQWPTLTAKALIAKLPELMAERAVDPAEVRPVTGWQTLGELLDWYGARVAADRQLSDDRRNTISSAMRCHLVPRLADLPLDQITVQALDERFYQPLQAEYELGSIKAWFGVLKSATAAAVRLRWLASDPLHSIYFSTFTKAQVQPRAGRLRPTLLPHLVEQIRAGDLADQLLVVMLLCFGSRIGETRQAKWLHVGWDEWHIPAANVKTRAEHNLPITAQMQELFSAWQTVAGSVWLFPAGGYGKSSRKSGRCLNAKEASEAVRRISQGEWTAHDLRKLARTRWTDQGTDYLIGELLLNHTLTGLDKTYIETHAKQQQREALATYHAWLWDNGLEGVVRELIVRLQEKRNRPQHPPRVA